MIELFGESPKSFIYHGNSVSTMEGWLKNHSDKIDLVYIDANKYISSNYKIIQKIGINQGRISHAAGFGEKRSKTQLLAEIKRLIVLAKELLSETGNIIVCTSPKLSSTIYTMLNEVFGLSNFVNEIIYKYNHINASTHHFGQSHDNILFYRKSRSGFFDPNPTAGKRGTERRNHMKKNISQDGRIYYSMTAGGKEYRYYEDDPVYMGDVWDDIGEQEDVSRTKIEAEKPLDLYKRLVVSVSPKSGSVCDPACGSGTIGLAAKSLNRQFLLCESSPLLANAAKLALAKSTADFGVVWEDINIGGKKPEIKFNCEDLKVQLSQYRVEGGEKYYSDNLLPTEDTLVEYWSVGHILDDKYQTDDFDLRSHEKPAIGKHLNIADKEGIPAALIWDAFGNQTLCMLDIDKIK